MKYQNSSGGQGGPEIYRYTASGGGIEWGQAAVGLLLATAALTAWRALASRVPAWADATGPVEWWLAQAAVALALAALLWVADATASRRWGWYHLRLGIVLGLCAAAGYWTVRTAMRTLTAGTT
jgi:hypothetical protein